MRGDTDRAAEPATPTADAGARDARRVSVARVWLCLWLDDWPSGVVCASSVTCGAVGAVSAVAWRVLSLLSLHHEGGETKVDGKDTT